MFFDLRALSMNRIFVENSSGDIRIIYFFIGIIILGVLLKSTLPKNNVFFFGAVNTKTGIRFLLEM